MADRYENNRDWEWWITISKTTAPGGGWLFHWHGEWHLGEDDHQAFKSLDAAKVYGRNGEDVVRYARVNDHHWRGYLPAEVTPIRHEERPEGDDDG